VDCSSAANTTTPIVPATGSAKPVRDPLLLELANGDRCSPQGGTSPEHNGVYYEFGCENGDATDLREQDGAFTVTYFDERRNAAGPLFVPRLWR
jgi:hypothetical protein